jgi:hypothetical protein
MGWIYAQTALITIVGANNDTGISYEDILRINDKTYRAKIEHYWEHLEPCEENWSERLIQRKGDLYFLTDKMREANKQSLSEWREDLDEMMSKNDRVC